MPGDAIEVPVGHRNDGGVWGPYTPHIDRCFLPGERPVETAKAALKPLTVRVLRVSRMLRASGPDGGFVSCSLESSSD